MNAPDPAAAGTYQLGDRMVKRMGYGAMQLAGPGVFGPPRDRAACVAVLRRAVELGVDHIDTSDYYGPFITNQIIREALAPYPANLTLVTKVAARRGPAGEWLPAMSPAELRAGIESNLKHLGLDAMEVVNLRSMHGELGPTEGSLDEQLEALAAMRDEGLVRHIGLSNVTRKQVEDGQKIVPIACVQNMYNLANRRDDAMIDWLSGQGIAYVPFFPLGGFSPLQSAELEVVAAELGATPMRVAQAWLLARSPNVLLIPGTSSVAHLEQNIAAASLALDAPTLARLDAIGA